MSKNTESTPRGRGRPVLYPLTGSQTKSVTSRLGKGQSVNSIAAELGVHPYAVLRVKRSLA